MPKYELPTHVISNIQNFLGRTDIKGAEVPAYVEIMNALRSPIEEDKE